MSDYIKREDVKRKAYDLDNNFVIDLCDVNLIPSEDVAPVRHGRWIDSSIPNEQYVCSECGGAAWYYDYRGDIAKSRYCPNCGAKMDEGEDNGTDD